MSVDPTMHVQQELACGTRGKSSWSQDPGLHFLAACVMQDRSARSFSVQTLRDTQSWLTSGTRSKEQLMLPVANARLKRSLRYRLTSTQRAKQRYHRSQVLQWCMLEPVGSQCSQLCALLRLFRSNARLQLPTFDICSRA